MAYEYTDERREPEGALPDVEVFGPEQVADCTHCDNSVLCSESRNQPCLECLDGIIVPDGKPGFYYAFGSPGAPWTSKPYGPFTTYQAALDDARRHGDCFEDNAPEQEKEIN